MRLETSSMEDPHSKQRKKICEKILSMQILHIIMEPGVVVKLYCILINVMHAGTKILHHCYQHLHKHCQLLRWWQLKTLRRQGKYHESSQIFKENNWKNHSKTVRSALMHGARHRSAYGHDYSGFLLSCPEHCSCHRMSRQMESFCVIKLLSLLWW
jgi:hypothetical protein